MERGAVPWSSVQVPFCNEGSFPGYQSSGSHFSSADPVLILHEWGRVLSSGFINTKQKHEQRRAK